MCHGSGGPRPVVWLEGRSTAFFPPRACKYRSNANELPYYMQRATDDHRNVSFETAVRTVAKRENQFIHIVAGSVDCLVSNDDSISIRYVVENNKGYW